MSAEIEKLVAELRSRAGELAGIHNRKTGLAVPHPEAVWFREIADALTALSTERDGWKGQYFDWQSRVSELNDRAQSAEAKVARLEEALKPFGDISGEGDADFPDHTLVEIRFGRSTVYSVRLGDLRRARQALAGGE